MEKSGEGHGNDTDPSEGIGNETGNIGEREPSAVDVIRASIPQTIIFGLQQPVQLVAHIVAI